MVDAPHDNGHDYARQPLFEVRSKDASIGVELAGASWLADNVTRIELDAIYGISTLYDINPVLTRQILEYTLEEPVKDRNVFLPYVLSDLSFDKEKFLPIINSTWFVDGLLPEERAFILALWVASGNELLYNELLDSYLVESMTISLPISGDVDIWIFHQGNFLKENMQTVVDTVLETENLIGSPFPLNDVIVVSVNGSKYDIGAGGMNFGNVILILLEDQIGMEYNISHEIGHFYFGSNMCPLWLFEGGADMVTTYVQSKSDYDAWDGTLSVDMQGTEYCLENNIPNINALNNPDYANEVALTTCGYILGPYLLTTLFTIMGEDTFSLALQKLYVSTLQYDPIPSEEKIYNTS